MTSKEKWPEKGIEKNNIHSDKSWDISSTLSSFTKNDIIKKLGIQETKEIKDIEEKIIMLANSWEKIGKLLGDYQEILQEKIDGLKGEEYIRWQIWYNLCIAMIYEKCWRKNDHKDAVNDASVYAENMWYLDIVSEIKKVFL